MPRIGHEKHSGRPAIFGGWKAFVVFAFGTVGCFGQPTSSISSVSTVQIVSSSSGMLSAIGDQIQLTAVAIDKDGGDVQAVITWLSSHPAVATVDGTGLVTAVGNGTATISATAGTVVGEFVVTVVQVPASIFIGSASILFEAFGSVTQVSVTVRDANGFQVPDARVTWTSSNPSVATVDSIGTITSTGNGLTSITATLGSVLTSLTVTVHQVAVEVAITPPSVAISALGQAVTLLASAFDANWFEMVGAQFVWASATPSVATVSQSGIIVAVDSGVADITATHTVSGLSASATITVSQVAMPFVIVPDTVMLSAVGETAQLTANPVDANGNPVPIVWTSSDSAIVTVDGNGLVMAVSQGNATITATAGGETANASVVVSSGSSSPTGGASCMLNGADRVTCCLCSF